MSHHLFRGLERLVSLASSEFIVKQTIITACLPPWVVPSASTPLDSGIVPYFQPATPSHFSSFHRRSFSSATLTASWEVRIWVRDVPWMESCSLSSCFGATDRAPPPHPHRYLAHTLTEHFRFFILLQCDFFSPLAPFLCLTSIPSQNQHGWLDNFTGSLTPKGPQRGGSFAPLLIQPAASPRPLSKLC